MLRHRTSEMLQRVLLKTDASCIAKPAQCGRVRRAPNLRRHVQICAAAEGYTPQEFGLTPAKPKTAYGEMLQYYLKMEPQLFRTAVEDQLARFREQKEAKDAAQDLLATKDSTELTLYRRMQEVRENDMKATLEDLLYVSILEKFIMLGVEMLPRLDGYVDVPSTNLKALTESMHSKEALELVREHILSVMGAAAYNRFSTEVIKMSKFQMAQVYAASIMFGYFLRRVDKRFQLEKSMGSLATPQGKDDAVARLERLFAQAEAEEPDSSPDTAPRSDSGSIFDVGQDQTSNSSSSSSSTTPNPADSSRTDSSGTASSSSRPDDSSLTSGRKSVLRQYVEQFDQATMVETARIVSQEGAALVERQTSALFGDIKELTKQMQAAVGAEAQSLEDLYARIAQAVASNSVETITMTVSTQRRAVLEAVAFGSFLRDCEDWIQLEYGLLSALPPPQLPPSMGGMRGPMM